MIIVFENLSADQADIYGLVLSSSNIRHLLKKGERGWDILVNETQYEKALNTIEQYLEENRDLRSKGEPPCYDYGKTLTGLWVSAILLACHVAIAIGNDSRSFIKAYGSSAFHILRGELYRSATSLMIHANALHLAGNIFGIAIFGTAVCTITGWGVGWLMILATGIAGNLLNALLYKAGHLSVGASTAVFGAIGILAAHQFVKKVRLPGRQMKAWLALGGGLALLGILGSGKYTDLTAHMFGFIAGIVLGAVYGFFVKRPAAKAYQVCFLVIALCLIIISWMMPFGHA
ncbi:MAG: rhomboid family intramembrane serine protease [Desulfobacterales bacterium]|nr:rhomboid family intramembrane serine protease [Desulfobacterales bacterium]